MRAKKIVTLVIFAVIGILIIIDTKNIAKSVVDGIYVCLNSIIPSLFAFLVFSSFLLDSGLYKIVFKPLCIVLKPLVKLCEPLTAIFILSLIGGYPVGAKLLADLYSSGKITSRTAENMLQYCYCSGPSFIIGIVGIAVFNSVYIGFMIYLSNLLACVICAAVSNRKSKITDFVAPDRVTINAELFITSVQKSAKVLYLICIMIVAFSAASSVMEFIGVNSLVSSIGSFFGNEGRNAVSIFKAILEISGVQDIIPNTFLTIPIISALMSFGGVCVLLQVYCICGKLFSVKRFLIARIPCALLSFIFACLLSLTIDTTVTAAAIQSEKQLAVFNNPFASICLLIMTGLLLVPSKSSAESSRGIKPMK